MKKELSYNSFTARLNREGLIEGLGSCLAVYQLSTTLENELLVGRSPTVTYPWRVSG